MKMELKDYFDYWDEFFKVWKNSRSQQEYYAGIAELERGFNIMPFKYPEGIMNCDCESTETFEYIPEPYWGWTPNSNKELKMFVVNYNPASGGPCQYKYSENVNSINLYSKYINEQLKNYIIFNGNKNKNKPSQFDTSNWHFNNRSNKLHQVNNKKKEYAIIENYLGIDLVPWHTKNVSALKGYLEGNFQSIQEWSLNFAIEASKKATGQFRNKVIVRTNLVTFKELFNKEFNDNFFIEGIKKPDEKKNNNDNFQQIKINNENDVEIYLLWGMRNSLPSKPFLDEIFKQE